MPTVLMVAEKPMLAQAIANILSGGRMSSRKGFNGACSVHEYDGNFNGQGARFKFTSTCGHVMGLDFLPKYNNWEKVDPAELYEADTQKKEANPKLRMNDFLASEGKGADYLVLWLDCDKEGENICFEVIDAVQHVMRRPYGNEQTVYRAHFSAITAKDIHQAMKTLVEPNENEALSVDARQELDLRIGCAFTRFQTKFFHQKYGDLDSSLISFGPCQTPTLGFCVSRYDLIQSFKPETYWVMQTSLKTVNKKSATEDELELKPEWNRGRIFDREVCQFFLDKVKSSKQATVVEVSTEERTKAKPIALNTVELMRIGSSGLGMGPSHSMSIAEQLYTQGYISYPRTETTQYPENFDLVGVVRDQTGSRFWGDQAKTILMKGIKKPKKGSDAGDHPPITPMKGDNEGRLTGDMGRIYEYIVKHFLATVSEDCKYLTTTARFKIGEEEFSMSGKTLISAGFTEFLTWQAITNDEKMPNLTKGEKLDLIDAKIVERQTTPPDLLTESELITLMEKHGIGTDASIPVHINNICQRNYVTVSGQGRRLVPTSLGIVLVHGYWKIDPDLVQPKMRAAVEEQLTLIAKGRAKYKAVTEHALKIFRMKFEYFVNNIAQMDELFEVSFTSLSESGKPFTRCGVCRRYMKLISARPTRLHCANCQQTYSLPQGRDIILRPYSDQKCPLDDFELIYYHGGGRSKGFTICPYCYNSPPFPGMVKHQGCNECLHPACRHSFTSLGVSPCPRCSNGIGVLVIDPGSGPKWKLACNKCPLILPVCDGALKLKSTDKRCVFCESQVVKIEYKPGKSVLPSKKDEYSGCLFCDDELKDQVDLNQLRQFDNWMCRGGGDSAGGGFRGYRGRGRGGGRGRGRGRGRGGSRGRGRSRP